MEPKPRGHPSPLYKNNVAVTYAYIILSYTFRNHFKIFLSEFFLHSLSVYHAFVVPEETRSSSGLESDSCHHVAARD